MNIFNTIKLQRPPSSRFDLSHDVKLTMKMGKLVPVLCHEVLPTDRYTVSSEALFRMMPMIAPIMHRVDIYFHTWFVPNRILWNNWEQFITGGQTNQPVAPALPTIAFNGPIAPSSLANYLGLPVTTTGRPQNPVNALPFAAYQRIWYEYYRDQNLQQENGLSLTDGVQTQQNADLLNILRDRPWEHDYFTAALPFAQKGPPVEMPINFDNASVVAVQPGQGLPTPAGQPQWRDSATSGPITNPAAADKIHATNSAGEASFVQGTTGVQSANAYFDPNGSLKIVGQVGALLNDLRTAQSLQGWLERNARTGSRFSEYLLGAFGLRSDDARLQRPEYIGGSMSTMSISEVLQTSSTDATSPQGTFAGHGISLNGGAPSSYFVKEHGYIITMLSIRPKTCYYNGLPRHFNKKDVFDYYDPKFAFLGEQGILNSELAFTDDGTHNDQVWGYIPRFSEYRYIPSRVCGQMATTLEHFHLARNFSTAPGVQAPPLNAEFIKCDPSKRIFAVTDPEEDEIIAQVIFKMFGSRPMPTYGTPATF